MIRYIILFTVFTALTTSAYADFRTGIDAYKNKDYRAALREFQPLADQGDADAQFMLGHMYASGKGVPQDYIKAHLWFNLAAAQGNERASSSRDKIARFMTAQQIAEAQNLAREWQSKETSEKQAGKDTKVSEGGAPTGAVLISEIQKNLAALGYDPGPADGKMGAKTRWAIRDYQNQAGLPMDGEPSQALLEQLQKEREKQIAQKKVPPKAETSPGSEAPKGLRVAPEDQTQEFIDQLKKIVQKGEDERKAEGPFLAELHDLIGRYDWPWRDRVFHDDFKDGDLTKDPVWTIVSGDFWVDSNKRLVTRFRAPAQKRKTSSDAEEEDTRDQIIKTILGEILKEKGEESNRSSQPTKAEIYSSVKISNSFSMDIELLMLGGGNKAVLEVGPHKGQQRDGGYRLIYVGGQNPTWELVRQSRRGTSIIDISKSALILNDGRPHVIQWQRFSDGGMIVAVDGEVIIRNRDRGFQDFFDGISILNHNGDYAFVRIDVAGTIQ